MLAEEKKPPTVPDWLIKLVLGGTAIGVGGYILYYFVSGGAAAASARKELEHWSSEYTRELKQITDQGRTPTSAEEEALKLKAQQMESAYDKLFQIYNVARDVLLAAIGITAGAWLVHKLARDYWDTHVKNVRTPQAALQLLREAHAIDLHAAGRTTLAVALHTQTETIFAKLYTPMIQAEITTLTAKLPTLVGAQLIWTQFLIQSLQIEMTTIIPSLIAAAGSILTVPLPLGKHKTYNLNFPLLY
jgi:hypothetical protein